MLRSIEQAAHLLPTQGPITVFVHHNTLHAFEELRFDAALGRSQRVYGSQPFLMEERYRRELARGRIKEADLAAVLEADLADRADELIGLLGTRFHLRLAMLKHSLRTAPSPELRWVVAETDALRTFRSDVPPEIRRRLVEGTRRWIMRDFRAGVANSGQLSEPLLEQLIEKTLDQFDRQKIESWHDAQWEEVCLQLLWRLSFDGVQRTGRTTPAPPAALRHRDALLQATGVDADELANEVLIRYAAAFLDQGYAHWPLPDRDAGFYQSFLRVYGHSGGVVPHWLMGIKRELARLQREQVTPLACIEESLDLLGVSAEERDEFIAASLLALRGWAGMIWQMETNAEWAVRPAPRGTLVEFLAVRLLLDRFAAAHIAKEALGDAEPLAMLRSRVTAIHAARTPTGKTQLAFLVFQLCQVRGVLPEELFRLPEKTWGQLADELSAFDDFERRRTFQLAYERRYRNQTLDALAIHNRCQQPNDAASRQAPSFQIVCCIDDREESFRRHLEEVDPACETLGYAGFFGVAMYYRGVADAHSRPLCPVAVKPQHYVKELPAYALEEVDRRRSRFRRLFGAASHQFHRGSRSLLGGAVTALFGTLASVPLVTRILFPRISAQIRKLFGQIVRPPAATQLLLERSEAKPGPDAGHVGYSVDEMTDVVEQTLRDTGLTRNFSRLVLFCGHGSSSLNNPHESAYNCGACSGGSGGPNARAFCQMANDPRVRARLADRGLDIPAEAYFIGAFHNTCTDGVDYFDLDRLPAAHQELFATTRRTIDEARRRNAHERCRRFESAELSLTPAAALAHVELRSEDLSQARPEYNHATNAAVFVGRRARSRGLFMDRRTFLASYDPTQDAEDGAILARILAAVIPVCAGINLEYYFSCVDVEGYGCGSKLPHNITSLLGVMEGASSDLRPGLSAQMIEIHEPLRILFVIETTPAALERIMTANPTIARLCRNEWVQLATLSPENATIHLFSNGRFERYVTESDQLPEAAASIDWYRGWRDHLGYASIKASVSPTPASRLKGRTPR
ncbi:DUF2309 domain-containing protein [Lacipirellula parvula]|uniref:DUF2309 domain-containing protein n=1 Tax=Lacipirellula parvula TaxID=2650471 RepID=UPI001E434CBC|nr:DUF2309 domain-containing protein [Lacipirellula parvula]